MTFFLKMSRIAMRLLRQGGGGAEEKLSTVTPSVSPRNILYRQLVKDRQIRYHKLFLSYRAVAYCMSIEPPGGARARARMRCIRENFARKKSPRVRCIGENLAPKISAHALYLRKLSVKSSHHRSTTAVTFA